VCDVARGDLPRNRPALRRAVGERWWTDDLTDDVLGRCHDRLRAAAGDWAALAPDGTLAFTWRHRIDPALVPLRRRA
jgi:hypothetical protein